MAKYTITLNEYAAYLTYGSLEERKHAIREWLFPEFIYEEELEKVFRPLFVNHFFFDEIGYETPELFKDRVNARLQEIIPHYSELYILNKTMTEWNFFEPDILYDEGNSLSESSFQDESFKENENFQNGDMEIRHYEENKEQEKIKEESEIGGEERADRNEERKENGSNELEVENGLESEEEKGENEKEDNNIQSESMEKTGKSGFTSGMMGYGDKEDFKSGSSGEVSGSVQEIDQSDKEITQSNGADSNYPQANIVANQNYYTEGTEGNQKKQIQKVGGQQESNNIQRNEEGQETGNSIEGRMENKEEETSGTELTEKMSGNSLKEKKIGIKELSKEGNRLLSKDGMEIKKFDAGIWVNRNGMTSGSEGMNELLNRIDSLNRNSASSKHNTGGKSNTRNGIRNIGIGRRGRVQRRPIPQIIQDIERTLRNIPKEMLGEFEDMFMQIW